MDQEARDAEKVNEALIALQADNVGTALAILRQVVANTPADYQTSLEDEEGNLILKFWDQEAFVHYVTWHKEHGTGRALRWMGNAYPRAFYYLGFIGVKTGQYRAALEYLEQGHHLEPTNPKFVFEKAQALAHAGDREAALALYEGVNELGPHVSVRDLAVAQRGCGFILIELGRLDEAEQALLLSLELEPGNRIAVHELRYIASLRAGEAPAPVDTVATATPNLAQCAVCGREYQKGVVFAQGVLRTVCDRCAGKLGKKWWQFWK